MKKTVSLVLLFSLATALVFQLPVLAADETTTTLLISPKPDVITTTTMTAVPNGLEKISSPELIKYFEQIKKVGNSLFGIKKATSTAVTSKKATSTATSTASSTAAILKKIAEIKKTGAEKIASLEHTSLYNKIVKIGNDLYGIRKAANTKTLPTLSDSAIACVSTAIDTKDTALANILTTANQEVSTAIAARTTCQKAALNLPSGQNEAIKTCNQTFKTAYQTANKKASEAQKKNWTTYKTSLKSCATSAGTTEINIEDGGEVLK